MSATEYYDFHLAIESDGDGGFVSQILRSLEGRASAGFRPPPSPPSQIGTSFRQDAEARGRVLFEHLFRGEVGKRLAGCLRRLDGLRDGHRRRLRIRLSIDPEEPALAELFRLDWEQMFDAEAGRFLTRSPQTTLVRDLELPMVLLDLPGTRPLRLLVVAAQPEGWKELDVAGEIERIQQAWDGAGEVEIEEMRHATFRTSATTCSIWSPFSTGARFVRPRPGKTKSSPM